MSAVRMPRPASRQGCRAAHARLRAVSIDASSASGNEASSRPVAGSMDLSTPANHGTIGLWPEHRRGGASTAHRQPAKRPPTTSSEIDGGRFPAKRSVGETVTVEADIFADGHDAIAAVLRYRVLLPIHGEVAAQPPEGLVHTWTEVPMAPLVNDRWRAEFPVTELGTYVFTVESWVDPFETWGRQLAKRMQAGQEIAT